MDTIALALIIRQAQVLIIRRVRTSDPVANLTWALPGGKVESGETAEQAVLREVKEETGLDVCIEGLIHSRTIPGTDLLAHYYRCALTPDSRTQPIADEHEVAECRWVSGTRALTLFTSDVAPPLRALLQDLKSI